MGTYEQYLKQKRKEALEREKNFAIYKVYSALGLLTLYEDLQLSEDEIVKFSEGVKRRSDEYMSRHDSLKKLAIDISKHSILIPGINCDAEGNVLEEYKNYSEE